MSKKESYPIPDGWEEERVQRLLQHYKSQTEEEAVAEDEVVLVDEEPKFRLGKLFRSRKEPGVAGLPVLSVTMNDGLVQRDTLDRKTDGKLAPNDHLLIRKGDLAYNMMRMWQGASGLARQDGIVSPAYVVVTPSDSIDPTFASYWFKSARMIHLFWAYSYGITGDRLRLYYKDFARIPVAVPSKNDQIRIGKTLAAADRAIAQTENLIDAKRRLKEGLAKLLLTGKRRLPDCKVQWCERSISDLAEVNPRMTKPPSLDTQVSFVPMANISEGGGLISPPVRPYRDVASGFTAFQDGDVLVSKITPCFENRKGALAQELSNGYGFGTTELHVLRAKASCSARFLFYVSMFEGFRARGVANMTGSAGQRRVPTGFIRSYRLRVPSLPEQERIATVIGAVDRSLEILEQKLASLRYLKHGLMQKLLPSEPRVEAS